MTTYTGTDNPDYLYGDYSSDDILEGKKGDDYLCGSSGNDTYIFNLGDGQDRIDDWGGVDTIQFGSGVTQENLEFQKNNEDLILKIKNTNDQITVQDFFYSYSTSYRIEKLKFADGTEKDLFTILNIGTASDLDDTLISNTQDSVVEAKKGNDVIIDFGGNDTYIFNLGDGQDAVTDSNGTDKIKFGAGISSADLIFERKDDDLIIRIKNTSDQLTVLYHFNDMWDSETQKYTYPCKIETLLFSDSSTLDLSTIQVIIAGTDGSDNIVGYALDDEIFEGKKGDDYISGYSGNDTYIFNIGDGQDRIYDSAGVDTIQFGSGITFDQLEFQKENSGYYDNLIIKINNSTDQIKIEYFLANYSTTYRIEKLKFADGAETDLLSVLNIGTASDSDDTLMTSSQDSIIEAKKGNDTITDLGGNDTYVFNSGDGQDIITDSNGTDKIKFGAGISSVDLIFERKDYDLIIRIRNSNDQITVLNYFSSSWNTNINEYTYFSKIETIVFSNGSTIDLSIIKAKIVGTDLDDSISTYYSDENILEGRKGNDSLYGSYGNDTYIFNLDDGQDRINDYSGSDTIQFGTGITQDHLVFEKDNNDLIIKIKNSTDQITINYFFSSTSDQIEKLKFIDGSEKDLLSLLDIGAHPIRMTFLSPVARIP